MITGEKWRETEKEGGGKKTVCCMASAKEEYIFTELTGASAGDTFLQSRYATKFRLRIV